MKGKMNEEKILGLILDIGVTMIRSGAETPRVEDSLYRISAAYGFTNNNFWVVPSNIQATVVGKNGNYLTQIRHVRRAGIDYDRLDQLNNLSRFACANTPDEETLQSMLDSIQNAMPQNVLLNYLGGILGAVGFGIFFNCDGSDAVSAAMAAILVVFLSRKLSRRERNPLVFNFLISFAAECLILLLARSGIGHHTGTITVGVIMLLISALGTTNGVKDLIHLDTLSGVMNITMSLAGAGGIAIGIALPLLLFRELNTQEVMQLETNVMVSLLSCTVGCVGFALWFDVRREKILYCAAGAFLTWGIYLIFTRITGIQFVATVCAAIGCGLYAQIVARIDKAPATIFSTVSIFPLIPGSSLYYAMYGIVLQNRQLAQEKTTELILACVGIVLGFLDVEVLSRYIWRKNLTKH